MCLKVLSHQGHDKAKAHLSLKAAGLFENLE